MLILDNLTRLACECWLAAKKTICFGLQGNYNIEHMYQAPKQDSKRFGLQGNYNIEHMYQAPQIHEVDINFVPSNCKVSEVTIHSK